MDGVTILNEFEVVTKTVFSWESFWWGALAGAIIGFVVAVVFGFVEGDWFEIEETNTWPVVTILGVSDEQETS